MLRWIHHQAEDATVDSSHVLVSSYTPMGTVPHLEVQDASGYGAGFVVNLYDGEGDDFGVTDLAIRATLAEAKRFAEQYHERFVLASYKATFAAKVARD